MLITCTLTCKQTNLRYLTDRRTRACRRACGWRELAVCGLGRGGAAEGGAEEPTKGCQSLHPQRWVEKFEGCALRDLSFFFLFKPAEREYGARPFGYNVHARKHSPTTKFNSTYNQCQRTTRPCVQGLKNVKETGLLPQLLNAQRSYRDLS